MRRDWMRVTSTMTTVFIITEAVIENIINFRYWLGNIA